MLKSKYLEKLESSEKDHTGNSKVTHNLVLTCPSVPKKLTIENLKFSY